MAPKNKDGGAEAAKATPAAAASGAGMTAEAAKEKADALFKKFKAKQDPKLVPKLEEVADSAQTAIAILSLVKVYLMQATNLVITKGQGPPLNPAERMLESNRLERDRQEDELEVEVVGILNKALQAAAKGFFAKERSLSCLMFAVQLAGLLRGRGSAAQLEERQPTVDRLFKLTETVARLAGHKKTFEALTWLDPAKEKTLPAFWPLETSLNEVSRSEQGEMSKHLNALWKVLALCKAADEQARLLAEGGGLLGLFRSRPSVEPILTDSPWEASKRVQERLVPWPILPDAERNRLAQKYLLHPSGNAEAMAAAREQARAKVSRDQANKLQKQEERKQALAQKSERAAEDHQRKVAQDEAAAAAARAKWAKLQLERGEAAQECLTQRLAAAADKGPEAQEAALLAQLRMRTADVRTTLQRQVQSKERSETEAAITRAALERLASGKPAFFACTPDLAALVASPEYGGLGAAALRGTAGSVLGDDDDKRVCELLNKALQCRMDDVVAMMRQLKFSGRASPVLTALGRLLPDKAPDLNDLDVSLRAVNLLAAEPDADALMLPAEGEPPADADLELLALAATEGPQAAAALVYRQAAEAYKQHYNLLEYSSMYTVCDLEAEDDVAAQQAADAAAAATVPDALGGTSAATDGTAAAQAAQSQGAPPPAGPSELSNIILYTFGLTVSQSHHLTDVQQPGATQSGDLELATLYGSSYDWAGLLISCLAGMRLLELLEAHERGERPVGWEWYHYTNALHIAVNPGISHGGGAVTAQLALAQPDRQVALRQAAAADAFTRWLIATQRKIDAHALAQQAAADAMEQQAAEQTPQQEPGQAAEQTPQQEPGQAAEQTPQQEPGQAPAAGREAQAKQQLGDEAAGSRAAAAAIPTAAAPEGPAGEEESLQFTPTLPFNGALCDLLMRGLAGVSLAAVDVPADVAAAAATACNSGSSSSSGGDAAAAAAQVSAWLRSQKQQLADRILLVLRQLYKGGVLTLCMTDAVLAFVIHEAPTSAVDAVVGKQQQQQQQQQQGEGEAAKDEAQRQQQQQQQQEAEEEAAAEADGEADEADTILSMRRTLTLLPQLPLASLHQLLAFLCLQLCWRWQAMPHVQKLCMEGEAELLSQCLELRNGKTAGSKSGAGQQEVVLTPTGLCWALPPAVAGTTAVEPDAAPHLPSGEGAPPAEMVARLASAIKQAGHAAAAAPNQPAPAEQPQQPQQQQDTAASSSNSSTVTPSKGEAAVAGPSFAPSEAAAAAGPSSAAGEAAGGGTKKLPPYLRLLECQEAWAPPTTPEAQLAAVRSLDPAPGLVQVLTARDDLTLVGIYAAAARCSALWASAFYKLMGDAQKLTEAVPTPALEPLREWLLKFNPSMPLPLKEGVWSDFERLVQQMRADIAQLEMYVALINHCGAAANAANTEAETARAEARLAEARRRLEAVPAGDEAARQAAQSEVEAHQQAVAAHYEVLKEHHDAITKLGQDLQKGRTKQVSKRAADQLATLNKMLFVLRAASRLGSGLAKEQRRDQLVAARELALTAIDELEATQVSRAHLIEEMMQYVRLLTEQLLLRSKMVQGWLLSHCLVSTHQQVAHDLLTRLLPVQWHDELARQRRAADEAALLAEEEAEKERRAREEARARERKEKLRQAENEKREAERRAKEEAERKAAAEREEQRKQRASASAGAKAGGGSRKAGGRLGDYRAELDDLEGAEEDEWEEVEAEKQEREAEARRQEGFNRMLEQAGAQADEGEWTEAATSHSARRQQQGQQGQQGQQARQQARRQGSPTSPRHEARKVLSVSRSALPSAPAMPVPKRASQASVGASWAEHAAAAAAAEAPGSGPSSSSASSATAAPVAPAPAAAAPAAGAAPAGGWSFDEWQQQEVAPPQQDAELDSLLADMGIPVAEQPPSASPQLVASPAEGEDDDEDEDLRRAIEASMDRSQDVVPSQARRDAASGSGASGSVAGGGGGAEEEAVPDGVGFTGLRNEAGEYNCFLNVLVQCLWQCAEFRQRLAAWGPEFAAADPVVAALQSLFKAFKAQQEGEGEDGSSPNGAAAGSPNGKAPPGFGPRSAPASPARLGPPGGGGTTPPTPAKAWQAGHKPAWLLQALDAANSGSNGGSRLQPVDPAKLRDALATLPGRKFAAGEMHDAAEVLLTIYERVMETERQLMGAAAAAEGSSAIEQVFGLKVQEEVHCSSCGRASHHSGYTQYFCMAQAVMLRMLCDMAPTMGQRLREAANQEMKSCDTDLGGCGRANCVNHFLQAAPRVFTLHLCWTTHNEEPADIASTLAAVDETVDLGEVYQGVERGLHRYALRSMVCYYGQHYQALVWVPGAGNKAKGESGAWLMFDDTRVSRVGAWADVRRKCEAGRIQPSVLFYEAAA